MKAVFLGTNGWYDTKTGSTLCTLIDAPEAYLVLDAGFGLAKLDGYIKSQAKPIYLFISHLHLDHTVGLHLLNKFSFSQGIDILLGPGLSGGLKRLIAPPYSLALNKLSMRVSVNEVKAGFRLPFALTALPLTHSVPCYGLRAVMGGETLAYAPDTGLCPNLYKLARDADLLIAECSYLPGERHPAWPHLNPSDAASAAKKSGVKRLALTHFEARRYNTFASRENALKAARKIFPKTFAPRDSKEIIL